MTKKTILLVDDEEEIAEVLNRAAASVFPEVTFVHVNSFTQAVTYLNGLNGVGPNLILLDLDLKSDLSGFDFLDRIRQHPQGRLIPTIMLTSNRNEATAQEAYARGANAFTPKPFTYAEWKLYVQQIRDFWFQTATIPWLYFDPSDQLT